MKEIYIMLSETGSFPSRIIRFFTKDTYTHISVSLNKELTEMYTFGRRYLYSIYPGGYIKECIHEKMYKRFKKTKIAVFELMITEEKYVEIADKLREMYVHKEMYGYNYKGVFLAHWKKRKKRKTCYYCSEFIYELLTEVKLISEQIGKQLFRPDEFRTLQVGKKMFEGLAREYSR